MSKSSLVSVIITSKNEALVIEELLKSLQKQSYKNIEIILVDNNSTDTTIKISEQYTKNIFNIGPERSAQRNFGVKKSNGEYLLFIDSDMRLSSRVIEACVREIKKNKSVAGIAIPEESVAETFWEKVKAFERSFYNEFGDPITDAARFFKKDVFLSVGGYDETITGPEDWDLPETIREHGYLISRIEEKIYHKERATSLISLFKKKYYYGLHVHRYLAKHQISTISPKTVYFLRPLFYKSWKRLLLHPMLAIGLFIMLMTQLLGGGLGYLIGRLRRL